MGPRLVCVGLLVVGGYLVAGCAAKPAPDPVPPVKAVGQTGQNGEKPTMKEPKLEINPNYKGN